MALFSREELDLIVSDAFGEKPKVRFPILLPSVKPLPGLPGGQQTTRNHGLAWRIATVLVCDDYSDEGADVDLRFWLCTALEALLRGSSKSIRQLVASWGVLESCIA